MTIPMGKGPRIVHETSGRIRFRWNRLIAPDLEPDYLEAWLSNLPGVSGARINPQGRSMVIRYDGDKIHREAIFSAFERIPTQAFARKTTLRTRQRLIDAAFQGLLAAAVPLLPPSAQGLVATAMSAPTILKGMDTLVNEGLKARVLDMTTIGTSLLRSDFTTAASISAMVVVGEYLRGMTDDHSNALLKSLTADPVEQVWVERAGIQSGVTFEEVRINDTVLCGSGELVAVDGIVIDGEAMVDKSSITGESAPVTVHPGEEILSGSVVVEGKLKIRAVRTGSESSMARIAEFMTKALSEQSQTEQKSDRLADALTPITLGLGAALYAATGDMERALSVLTIDFACAVKFPAPVVFKTSMYTAAREGVLFKSGISLEALAEVDAVVFDKTGTLTRGELAVTDILPRKGLNENELIKIAAAVEDRHGHPIGRGILRAAEQRSLAPHSASDVDLSIAHGVSGMVNGELVRVGSRHFISEDCGVDCASLSPQAKKLRAEGKSLVYVSREGKLEGIVALRDSIRQEAHTVLDRLAKSGIKKMVMLTGDHEGTIQTFMQSLPRLDNIRAGLTPEQKAKVVGELQQEGYRVAVVGDGVNDAPAFTAAQVGICMSRSTGLARESAQIVLDNDSLEGLVTARSMAKRAERILQNCFNTGVGVNIGLLAAASAGLLRPATAAALHNGNTFAILGSAAWASSRPATNDNK